LVRELNSAAEIFHEDSCVGEEPKVLIEFKRTLFSGLSTAHEQVQEIPDVQQRCQLFDVPKGEEPTDSGSCEPDS
jgi:hypothetical protein